MANSRGHTFQFAYIDEKLSGAIRVLATSDRSLRERLETAWLSCHTLTHKATEWNTGQDREEFEVLHKQLTAVKPVGDEGAVRATLAAMGVDEMRQIATGLFDLQQQYTRLHHERMGKAGV